MPITAEHREELQSATREAKLAILQKIKDQLAGLGEGTIRVGALGSSGIRDLAEAYAWLEHPNQPHGGQAKITATRI